MQHRHKVIKCCWENNTNRPTVYKVAINLQFVKKKKKKIPLKYNKVKPNKTRDAFKGRYLRKVDRVVLRD